MEVLLVVFFWKTFQECAIETSCLYFTVNDTHKKDFPREMLVYLKIIIIEM